MMKDFALLILPATLLDGSQFNRVALLSDIPTDEFALPKPRTLRDPGSGESFQVSYERPILEFISRAGPHEGEHEDRVRFCLQPFLTYPIEIEPQPESRNCPIFLTTRSEPDRPVVVNPRRCLCSFDAHLPTISPDVLWMLGDRKSTSGSRQLPQRIQNAAAAVTLESGMVIPFRGVLEEGIGNSACILLERVNQNTFVCDVYSERPDRLRAGTDLLRRLNSPENGEDMSCSVGRVVDGGSAAIS